MMLSGAVRLLRSLKLTVALIICLGSVFLLGVVIPQKDLLGKDLYMLWKAKRPTLVAVLEFLGLTDIYVSPLMLALWAVFFLNLVMVMWGRIPSIWRRCANMSMPSSIEGLRKSGNYAVVEAGDMERARAVLGGRGYRVFSEGSALRAVKNRLSPLATVLFHLSFLLLLIGGVTSFYTKFRAEAAVAVGETFTGEYDKLSRPKTGGIPRAVFTLESVEPSYYEGDIPVDLKVVLRTPEGRRVIGINRPYKKGPLAFVIQDMDVAPLFVLRDGEGNELDGAYVKLKVLGGGEDSFEMHGHEFRTFFYTNYSEGFKSVEKSTSALPQALKQSPLSAGRRQKREIVEPAFYVAVFRDGKMLGTKTIALKEHIEFNGLKLFFEDYGYWINFLVVREYGLGVVYAGFALMTAALVMRFAFYRRDLTGIMEDGRLHIAGRAEFFPSLFADEFGAIVDALKSG